MIRPGGSVWAVVAGLAAGVLLTGCWLPQQAPLPNQATNGADLVSLVCSSAVFCVAAGNFQQPPIDSEQPLPFFDVLTSNQWTPVTAPLPSNADGTVARVTSVACISPGSCVGVGNYEVSQGDTQGLIETLTDGQWRATQAPLPIDASSTRQGVVLASVACGSDGTCAAIGQYSGPDAEFPSWSSRRFQVAGGVQLHHRVQSEV